MKNGMKKERKVKQKDNVKLGDEENGVGGEKELIGVVEQLEIGKDVEGILREDRIVGEDKGEKEMKGLDKRKRRRIENIVSVGIESKENEGDGEKIKVEEK